jgi:hypothetical protein
MTIKDHVTLSGTYKHVKIDEMDAECNLETMYHESITGEFIVLTPHM